MFQHVVPLSATDDRASERSTPAADVDFAAGRDHVTDPANILRCVVMSLRRRLRQRSMNARHASAGVALSVVIASVLVGESRASAVGADQSEPPAVLATSPAPEPILAVGSRGDAVRELERRLDLLRFDVGEVDGRFDSQTRQAVFAFQKLNKLPKTGRVGDDFREILATASVVGGVIPNGGLPRVEVDLGRQVLMLFDEYGLLRVLNISSGSEKKYCQFSKKTEQEVCGDARTPRGNYRVQRRIEGWRESDLGRLYNPLYFDGGFAIHGSPSVPEYPASHGCVRISMRSAEWFPAAVKDGTPVYLFD